MARKAGDEAAATSQRFAPGRLDRQMEMARWAGDETDHGKARLDAVCTTDQYMRNLEDNSVEACWHRYKSIWGPRPGTLTG